jgi:hypothetical protein
MLLAAELLYVTGQNGQGDNCLMATDMVRLTRFDHWPAFHVAVANPVSALSKHSFEAHDAFSEPRGWTCGGGPASNEKTKAHHGKAKAPQCVKVTHPRETPIASLNKKVALLKRERDEALEQQIATSKVLQVHFDFARQA